MVTITDISKETGYSSATVSRCINNTGHVSSKAREKITKSINDLGFKVHNNRRLKSNRTPLFIGVVVSKIDSPFYSKIIKSVNAVAKEFNMTLIIKEAGFSLEGELEALNSLEEINCRPIVLYSKFLSDSDLKNILIKNDSICLISRKVDGLINRCVWLDCYHGTYLATKSLLNQGHKNIVFINSELEENEERSKANGYIGAMDELGLEHVIYNINEDLISKDAYPKLVKNIQKEHNVSAIVFFNDIYAAIAMNELKAKGLKIPEDLSIVGFDDVMEQHYFSTELTTVKYPIEDMADSAARLAINNQDPTAKKKVCFFPILIWRKSVGNYVR